MADVNGTPCLVVRDSATAPYSEQTPSGRFNILAASSDQENAPILAGMWNRDDLENGDNIFESDHDEVKFVTAGEAVLKDISTGKIFHVTPGSVIWIPKGCKISVMRSKGLSTFFVEQSSCPPEVILPECPVRTADKIKFLCAVLTERYIERNRKSRQSYERALTVLPGGNTRHVLHHNPFPMVIISGRDCLVTSEDGVEYIDFVSEYSAAMLGHKHPDVLTAIQKVSERGWNLGGTSKEEVELATLLTSRFRSMDKIRFCNSGTEANTMALIVALSYTKRKKILAFKNAYHGGFYGFGEAVSPTTVPFDFVLGRYNDICATEKLITDDLAAIIVEPMQGAGGLIPATRDFLQFLKEAATRVGAVLIFDEVVTSRLHFNGLQGHYDVCPDMTTIGKFFGGGFSFGAFGGRHDIMEILDPRAGNLTHSGTFNNNAFTMTAGIVACKTMTEEAIARVNLLGDRLRDGINSVGKLGSSVLLTSTGIGSMVGIHYHGPDPGSLKDAFFFHMLENGIYIGKRDFMALNILHEEQHIDKAMEAVRSFMAAISEES